MQENYQLKQSAYPITGNQDCNWNRGVVRFAPLLSAAEYPSERGQYECIFPRNLSQQDWNDAVKNNFGTAFR